MDWAEVKPVLAATYRLLGRAEQTSGPAVAEELQRGADDERTAAILKRLHDTGYIEGRFVWQEAMPVSIFPTEKGLQQTSGWPVPGGGTDQVQLLLRLIDERIADAKTPEEEKGRLLRVRDAVGGVGREVLAEVLAAYVARQTGASGE